MKDSPTRIKPLVPYEELYAGWHRVDRRVVRRSSNGRSAQLPAYASAHPPG